MEQHYLVPQQYTGPAKDFEHQVLAESAEDAADWFVDAKDRMLDVNKWKDYATAFSAAFRLTDAHGKEVNRRAHKGDHIKIDIPGPGPAAGGGYDWVLVEAIEYDDYPDDDRETFAMRVHPVADPANSNGDVAHFFSEQASSTFVIERIGTQLRASYHGRNETLNTDAGILDKVRNSLVGMTAWAGMSDAQWNSLIKGFIE